MIIPAHPYPNRPQVGVIDTILQEPITKPWIVPVLHEQEPGVEARLTLSLLEIIIQPRVPFHRSHLPFINIGTDFFSLTKTLLISKGNKAHKKAILVLLVFHQCLYGK